MRIGINAGLIIWIIFADINMLVFMIIVAYMCKIVCHEVTLKFSLNWVFKKNY